MLSLDRTFRALSDQTRLRILNLLSQGELPVGDLVAVTDAPQSSISQHLAALKAAGLVADRRLGRKRFYMLSKPRSLTHAKVAECLRDCFGDVAALRKDLSRLKNLRPSLKSLPAAQASP